MPALPRRIPLMNRYPWTPSDPVRHQPDNVYLFSHSRPCRKPRADRHPVTADHTAAAPPPPSTDTIRPAPTPASTAAASISPTTTSRTPPTDGTTSDVPSASNISNITSRDVDLVHTCLHCCRTFTSNIGLVGHLRINRTETGEPVPGTPIYTRRVLLRCPQCPCTFTHHMGPSGRMRIHKSLRKTTAGYTTSSRFPPPALTPHNTITNHKHPIATFYASGKCATQLRLHAAPLLHTPATPSAPLRATFGLAGGTVAVRVSSLSAFVTLPSCPPHTVSIRSWDARVLEANQRCPHSDWLADVETTKDAHTRPQHLEGGRRQQLAWSALTATAHTAFVYTLSKQ
nr:unnamed protein product [Spirometra erinaceieuropaei]